MALIKDAHGKVEFFFTSCKNLSFDLHSDRPALKALTQQTSKKETGLRSKTPSVVLVLPFFVVFALQSYYSMQLQKKFLLEADPSQFDHAQLLGSFL